MKRTLLFGLLIPVAAAGLSGCSMQVPQVAVSPNGTWVATTGEGGLFVRKVGSTRLRRILPVADLVYPRFSPDNRYVVVQEDPVLPSGKLKKSTNPRKSPSTTWIADIQEATSKRLRFRLDPPFAWSADGRRILGWSAPEIASIVDARSRKVVGHLSVDRPTDAIWLPDGRLVLAGSGSVTIVHGGDRRSIPAVAGAPGGLCTNGRRVVWLEKGNVSSNAETQDITLRVRTLNLETGAVSMVGEQRSVSKLLGAQIIPFIAQATLDPAGDRLSIAATTVKGPPGVLERLDALSRKLSEDSLTKKRRDPALDGEARTLEKKLDFENVVVVLDLSSGKLALLSRHRLMPGSSEGGAVDQAWSADGMVLVTAFFGNTEIDKVGQVAR
jgi:hypothetical protein